MTDGFCSGCGAQANDGVCVCLCHRFALRPNFDFGKMANFISKANYSLHDIFFWVN